MHKEQNEKYIGSSSQGVVSRRPGSQGLFPVHLRQVALGPLIILGRAPMYHILLICTNLWMSQMMVYTISTPLTKHGNEPDDDLYKINTSY